MDYVRGNLANDLRLDALAEISHSSPYHFHRMFKAVAGETVAQFTRRARLERAAYLMKANPTRTLHSVALDVGFPAQAEFSRAFKRQYGVSPSAWDRTSRLDAVSVRPASPRPASPPSPARVVEHPPCRVAYLRMRTWFEVEVLRPGLERLTRWLEARGIAWRGAALIGTSWDHYETTPLDRVHYDLGCVVPNDVTADGDIGIYELPALRAVEVHCAGDLGQVARAWDHLYEEWLPRSRYEPADLPAMKRFRVARAIRRSRVRGVGAAYRLKWIGYDRGKPAKESPAESDTKRPHTAPPSGGSGPTTGR